eukprot:3674285-Amphidinium_carterae.1
MLQKHTRVAPRWGLTTQARSAKTCSNGQARAAVWEHPRTCLVCTVELPGIATQASPIRKQRYLTASVSISDGSASARQFSVLAAIALKPTRS